MGGKLLNGLEPWRLDPNVIWDRLALGLDLFGPYADWLWIMLVFWTAAGAQNTMAFVTENGAPGEIVAVYVDGPPVTGMAMPFTVTPLLGSKTDPVGITTSTGTSNVRSGASSFAKQALQ